MYILGIDIGSSFLKASILDLEKKEIGKSQTVPTPGFLEENSIKKELSMEKLVLEVKQIIDTFLENYPLSGIVLSTQMHGYMLFSKNGDTHSNYVTWQDRRCTKKDNGGKTTLEVVDTLLQNGRFYEDGVALKPNYSMPALYHFARNTRLEENTEYAMLGDGLIRLLTGSKVPIHPTVAASSGMYSLKKKDWDRTLLKALHLDSIHFPEVKEIRGAVAAYDSSEGKIPIYLALGDHQCAVLGSGVLDGDIVINIGTGGQISYVDQVVNFGNYETRPFFEGRFLRTIAQLPSGRSLNVLVEFVKSIAEKLMPNKYINELEIWHMLDSLLIGNATINVSDVPEIDFSFFSESKGCISQITDTNFTLEGLFIGAYASMAKSYFSSYKELLGEDVRLARKIILTGGVVRKAPLLQKFITDKFEVPCVMAPYMDDTMIGLLRYACWCKGEEPLFAEKADCSKKGMKV